ncbi:MAG: hypothetical protein PVG03_13425 [Desulfarculaceae bacterium]|jgi:hypothetical protein
MSISPEREAELKGQGWTRQTMTNEPRLSEAVQEYRGLGFEVHLEPVNPKACESQSECTMCFDKPEVAKEFKIIFTRPSSADSGNEDLF